MNWLIFCRNGFLIEPTDTTEIESALLTLLTDSNVWEQKVQNGLSNIHKYSWSAHCQRHLTTLAEAERIRKSVPEPPSEGMNSMGKTESFLHLQELADEEIEGGFGRVARVAHIPAQERISNKYAGVIAISIETLSPEVCSMTLQSLFLLSVIQEVVVFSCILICIFPLLYSREQRLLDLLSIV